MNIRRVKKGCHKPPALASSPFLPNETMGTCLSSLRACPPCILPLSSLAEHSIRFLLADASQALILVLLLVKKFESSHPDAELRMLEVFYHKIYKVVHFRSLDKPKEQGFCLELSRINTYDEVVGRIALVLGSSILDWTILTVLLKGLMQHIRIGTRMRSL